VKIALAGVLVYPVVAALLFRTTSLGLLDALFLVGLLELLPTVALGQIAMVRGMVIERVPAYLNSGSTILVLGIVGILMGRRLVGLDGLGLGAPPSTDDALWTGGLWAAGVGTLWAFRWLRGLVGIEETELVHHLLPVTGRERRLFVGLSLCAGFGEETAYRGYAISALVLATGSVSFALVVTSATFGVLHAYQGSLGVVRTGVVGFIMGAAFLHTGSLWPALFAHALIDVTAGLVLRERLL